MPGYDKIYILGFMGSGKTTIGMKLAAHLNWSFIDLDRDIEERTGLTIPELFSRHGEAYFRRVESDMLKNLRTINRAVISTGGGAPCFGGNMEFMQETGLTIYLKLAPGQLRSRLSGTGQERPLIRNLNDEELLQFIEEKLAEREKWYSLAELTVDGFNPDITSIYSQVVSKLDT